MAIKTAVMRVKVERGRPVDGGVAGWRRGGLGLCRHAQGGVACMARKGVLTTHTPAHTEVSSEVSAKCSD